jgi:hypothetical protein
MDDFVNTVSVGAHIARGDKTLPKGFMIDGKYVKNKPSGVKQKGKGFIKDLLKTGAKQALRAAAQTGLDVLDNKRSLKEAIKTHGLRAIKATAQPLLARGGPKRSTRGGPKRGRKAPPIKRAPMNRAAIKRAPKKPAIKRPKRAPIKRPAMKRAPKKLARPAMKRPIKRPKRVLDIFD